MILRCTRDLRPPTFHSAAFGSQNSLKSTLRLIWHFLFAPTDGAKDPAQSSESPLTDRHKYGLYFCLAVRPVSRTARLHFSINTIEQR